MTIDEQVQHYASSYSGILPADLIEKSREWWRKWWRKELEQAYEAGQKSERERVALLVSQAGTNNICLLAGRDNFTGTYWISANMLYFVLTGRHLNSDFDSGVIERNPMMDEVVDESLKQMEG